MSFDPNSFAERLPDGGPRYVETPSEAGFRLPAEPYNAVSALTFALVAAYWTRKLWREKERSLLLLVSMPILFVGGLGGALYHGTRTSKVFFLLDVVPIFFLAALVAIWLWQRARASRLWLAGFLTLGTAAQAAAFGTLAPHDAVNASYVTLALLIILPLGLNLWRDKGRGFGFAAAALTSFGAALFFRIADGWGPHPLFPMGTHWLWHAFGCLSTAMVIAYVHALSSTEAK